MVAFINLFFIPVLPLYLLCKREGRAFAVSLELLFQYCIAASCVIPVTKAILFLPTTLFHAFIPPDSAYYTIAALLAAWLLSLLCMVRREISFQIEVIRKEEKHAE